MMLIFVVGLLICLTSTSCAPEAPDKPGHCYINGGYIKVGESAAAPIGLCYENICEAEDSETTNIVTRGCPMFKIASYCHLSEEDLSKPYPKCCRQPVCPPQSES